MPVHQNSNKNDSNNNKQVTNTRSGRRYYSEHGLLLPPPTMTDLITSHQQHRHHLPLGIFSLSTAEEQQQRQCVLDLIDQALLILNSPLHAGEEGSTVESSATKFKGKRIRRNTNLEQQ